MKKLVLSFCLSLVLGTMTAANMGEQFPMSVYYEQPTEIVTPNPRMPAAPIYVSRDEHVFTFNSSLTGEFVEMLNGDEVLYTTIIGEDGTVVIPENISGEVELRLYRGRLVYYAIVDL